MANKLDKSNWTGTWVLSSRVCSEILAEVGIDVDEALSPLSAYGTMRALRGEYPIFTASQFHSEDKLKRWALDVAQGGRVIALISPNTGYYTNLVAAPVDVNAEKLVRRLVKFAIEREPAAVAEGWEGLLGTVLRVARQKAESVEVQPWDSAMVVNATPAALAGSLGLEYELFTDAKQAVS